MTPHRLALGWMLFCLCLFAAPTTFADTRDIQSRWVSAISADNVSVLRALLDEAGELGEIGSADKNEGSVSEPLWKVTASNGKSALMVACKVGDAALAMRLVELGSNIQDRTITNGTAFMFAVLGNQTTLAQWLVGLGANIDAQGSNGWTSVMIASAKGLNTTLDWLLSEGANAQTPDVYGFTPLMRASDNGHTTAVRLLLGEGVGHSGAADSGVSSGDSADGPVDGHAIAVDVHWQDELENTALHYAVAGNFHEIVQLLLKADASVKTKNKAGLSALDLAKKNANESTGNASLKKRQRVLLKTLMDVDKAG